MIPTPAGWFADMLLKEAVTYRFNEVGFWTIVPMSRCPGGPVDCFVIEISHNASVSVFLHGDTLQQPVDAVIVFGR